MMSRGTAGLLGRNRRIYVLLGLLLGAMTLVALLTSGTPGGLAQTTAGCPAGVATPASGANTTICGTCTAPDAAGKTECTFTSDTPVDAGGTLTLSVTNPVGASITTVS